MSLIYGVFEMNKFISLTCLTLTAGLFSVTALAGKDGNGNGAPSGAHYNLNVIGMDRDSDADGLNGNGRRIFVKLWGNTKIMLTEGDFEVVDYNGLDGEATFMLPAADADCDGLSDYSAYVRGLGRGSSTIETCFVDKKTSELLCSGTEITVIEGGKRPRFTNVSKSLLTVVWDADGDLDLDRTPLFGDDNYGYAWDYNNAGLRLAQFRFYDEYTLLDDGEYDYNCTQ
jgi:hypothetical protein